MKLSKEFIEGYCQALIDTNENISSDLDVIAHVYYVDLTDSYEVAINWAVAFDNYKTEEIREVREFKISNLKDFGFELAIFLDKLSEVVYNNDYNSNEAKEEGTAEMELDIKRNK